MKLLKVSFWLFLAFIVSSRLFSQDLAISKDSLNQYDDKGKKDGVWIEYLNENFRVVKKERKAMFYRYVKHQHGTCYHTSLIPRCVFKKFIIKSNTINDSIQKPILLHGNYSIYDNNNKLLGKCYFDSGWLISDTSYHWNGAISSIIDYSDKYENFECSNVKYLFNEKGVLYFLGYEILEDSKWRVVRIK